MVSHKWSITHISVLNNYNILFILNSLYKIIRYLLTGIIYRLKRFHIITNHHVDFCLSILFTNLSCMFTLCITGIYSNPLFIKFFYTTLQVFNKKCRMSTLVYYKFANNKHESE